MSIFFVKAVKIEAGTHRWHDPEIEMLLRCFHAQEGLATVLIEGALEIRTVW